MKLRDKVAIVTGGNTGIGAAAARLLAREGASVVLVARGQQAGDAIAQEIRAVGATARFIAADLTSAAACKELIADVMASEGRIDVLFNNAGTLEIKGSVVDTSEEDWDFAIAANLTSVFLCCKYVIPEMIRNGGGVIVNNASISAVIGSPGAAAYNASKAGVALLTKSIAIDFATSGIRANCLCPGAILSPTNTRQIESGPDPAETYRTLLSQHPIGRLGTPEDVASAVLFLATDDSSFITGASLMVDGGYTAI
jgi:NAD(P)-dependent dehydrogenase (short-subunit alcohol dehydrogenase family)